MWASTLKGWGKLILTRDLPQHRALASHSLRTEHRDLAHLWPGEMRSVIPRALWQAGWTEMGKMRPELGGCSRIYGKCTLGLWRGLRGQLGSTIATGTNCFWGPNSLFCSNLPRLHQPSSRRKCCKAVSEEKPTTSACLFSPGDAHYNFNWFAQNTSGETAVQSPNISIMLRFLQDWSQI